MYIHQQLLDLIESQGHPNKVLIIYGPRQIGKTTLLNQLLRKRENYLLLNGDDLGTHEYLSSQSITKLKALVGNHRLLAIDEAQQISNIGVNLKLLIDHCKDLQIIATGSSSFSLAKQVGEPLTGRKITYQLYPLSQMELNQIENPVETKANLKERLIYGSYPEVILSKTIEKKREYLRELTHSYLFKDILELDGVRKSKVITQLVQLLSFQIGKEVSLSELGQQLGLNKITVSRYIDLLEKSFVLISLGGFSRNLRKEISKKSRYYFYDLGVRNALINQFNTFNMRDDIGPLWENYLVIERLKKQSYTHLHSNNYYWRTYDQQEIDWVEEREGHLYGYEFKWGDRLGKAPGDWLKTYNNASFEVVNEQNYLEFIANNK